VGPAPPLLPIILSSNRLIRFERELEALRKELAEATARSGRSSPVSDELNSPHQSPELAGQRVGKEFSPKMPSIDLAMSEGVPIAASDVRGKTE
jgi:hypothetical protein